MKNYILLFVLAIMLAGCSLKTPEDSSSYHHMTMDEAVTLMEKEEDYIILDVRTEEEFKAEHIPDAINVPNETIDGEISVLPDKNKIIFVYCRSGNRSKQASKKLAELGYTNIIDIGGIVEWKGDTVKED